MYSFFPLLFPIFSQYSFRISGNRGYDNNRVRYFVSHVFPVSDLYTMTTTIYLKQTVYWTFRVLVNTWEEVLTFFSVSVCRSLVSFTPACSTTDLMLSSSFRITGICAETSRTRAPGKQWVYTLPLANVARTCRTMESPTITASRSVSRRGAKRLQVEISKTGGGGGDWISSGPPLLLLHPGFPGAGVKDIWEDRVPGARGLCRETYGVEVVGLLAVCSILTPDLWASTRDVSSVALCSLKLGLLPNQLANLLLHGLQLQPQRMQLERVLTFPQR